MKVGFTGTRRGMSYAQLKRVNELLRELAPTEFHHGDCIGADLEAHIAARGVGGIRIVAHPPVDPSARAWVVADRLYEPLPYIERNHRIVEEVDVMIATPGEYTQQIRSGTWATIRYARSHDVPVFIVCPDGLGPR